MDTLNSDLQWQFRRDAARDLFLWSNRGNSHSDIWFTQPEGKRLTFGTKGCQGAKIGLSEGEGMGHVGDYETYVIILGHELNPDTSVIKEQFSEKVDYQVDTPGIISCKEIRYFWVDWGTGRLQVGKGLTVGDNMFMDYQPKDPHEVKSITPYFGNGAGTDSHFHFRHVEENYYLLTSRGNYTSKEAHVINIEQRDVFVFRVRACNDAVLELRRKYGEHTAGTPRHVRVGLGRSKFDGDKSTIDFVLEDGETIDMTFSYNSPDILSCYSYKSFWFSWKRAYLEVGSGEIPYENKLFGMRDPYLPFSVQQLFLGSLLGERVEWQFSRPQAKALTLATLPFYGHKQAWLTTAERRVFNFKVMASMEVHVALSTYVGTTEVATYMVRISNSGDPTRLSGIWRVGKQSEGTFIPTNNVLDPYNPTSLWIAWHRGSVEFGRGRDEGVNSMISFLDRDTTGPLEINALSVSSASLAYWDIGNTEEKEFIVHTPQETTPKYQYFWMVTYHVVLPFKLRVENSANIVLSNLPGIVSKDAVEIVIGAARPGLPGEQVTEIRNVNTGKKESANTPNIVDSSEIRMFWISWFGDSVRVGRGYPLEGLLVELTIKDLFSIRGISFSTEATDPAEWIFNQDLASEIRMMTQDKYRYDQLWRTVDDQTSQVFRVKAANDVNILLSSALQITDKNSYEITIGKEGNTETVIRDGNHLHTRSTKDILSSEELRTFWVSWANGEIRVGRGAYVGSDLVLHWTDPEPHPVHALSIATEKGATGQFEFYQLTGDTYHFTTQRSDIKMAIMSTQNDHISFKSFGCGPAAIQLMSDFIEQPGGSLLYEVIIGNGNNSHVTIYKFVEVSLVLIAETTYPDVLRCGSGINLWVGWRDGLIQVGRGVYPHNIILEGRDEQEIRSMNAFSFSSSNEGPEYPLHWEIFQGAVDRIAYHTVGPTPSYDSFWMNVGKRDYVTFSLLTCADAYVAMSQLTGIASIASYEFVLETKPAVFRLSIRSEDKEVKSKEILNPNKCENHVHNLWVGYANGTVEVGMGTVFGSSSILKYSAENPHEVNFLSLASSDHAAWGFQNIEGNMYSYKSEGVSENDLPNYGDLRMVPLRHQQEISFQLESKSDARIALSADVESVSTRTYEVVLGKQQDDGNEVSSIRMKVNGDDEVNITTKGMMAANTFRPYWLRWSDQHVRLGMGAPGTLELLSWRIPLTGHPIRALSFGSGSSPNAYWRLNVAQAESIHAITQGNTDDKNRFWVSVVGQDSLVLQVATCKHAQIYLTSIPYETRTEAYLIELSTDDGFTKIFYVPTGKLLAKYPTGSILKCDEYRAFWVHWTETQVSAGRGGHVRRHTLVRAILSSVLPITSVGVSSYKTEKGYWNVLRSQGNVYRTYTSADYDMSYSTLAVNRRYIVPFFLRACGDAHIRLVEDWDGHYIELIIGSYGNTKVELKYAGVSTPVTEVEAVDVLNCNQLRRFWLSWYGGEIRFGSGPMYTHDILAWMYTPPGAERPIPFSAKFMLVATAGNVGEWELEQGNPTDACQESFYMDKSKDEGVATNCFHLHGVGGVTLAECIETACQHGGNAINYRTDWGCNVKRCVDIRDLKYTTIHGGWNIYVLSEQLDTYIARTTRQLGMNYDQHWISVTGETSTVFSVQACHDVHLALAAVPGNSATAAYEVVIGGWDNSVSAIRENAGILSEPVVSKPTQGILTCEFQYFWISWDGNHIKVGQGKVVGLELFLEWRPSSPIHEINSIGISTAAGADGLWMFGNLQEHKPPSPEEEDEKYVMKTDGKSGFKSHRWSLAKDFFTFELMACADAQIMLAHVPGQYNTNSYRIDLGTEGNMKTTIAAPDGSVPTVSESSPNVLNCSALKPFWVSVRPASISIGQGPYGMNTIVAMNDQKMLTINEIALSTTNNKEGYWVIRQSAGHLFKFVTPNTQRYREIWRSVANTNYITFKVKTCHDAHILMSNGIETTDNVYEVAIGMGGSTSSAIRKGMQGENLVWPRTPGIVNCYEFRSFWIRWYQGIEVGYGTKPGRTPFMRLHEVASRPVKAISIMTGWGVEGEWHFSDLDGDSFYLTTKEDVNYDHVWLYEQTHSFEFNLRTCKTASIYLGETPFKSATQYRGYEIVISGVPEAMSEIRRYPMESDEQTPVKAYRPTVGLVDCHRFKRFWISWSIGMIKLGQGQLEENTVLYWVNDRPFPVRALSLKTSPSVDMEAATEWQFSSRAAKSTIFVSHKDAGFANWRTVDGRGFLTFRVLACSDAEILVSPSAGTVYGHVIGLGINKEKSVIRAPVTDEILISKDGNPLDCDSGIWFWVSWWNGKLSVGTGPEVGINQLLSYGMSEGGDKYEVGAIGFRTTATIGTWEFTQFEDREFEISTVVSEFYEHMWLITPHNSIRFKVKACANANIALAAVPGKSDLTGTYAYEINIGTSDKRHIELWKYGDGSQINASSTGTLLKRSTLTADIVDCDSFVPFWITWTNWWTKNHIRLGIGPEVYVAQEFEYEDTSPYKITGVSFTTEDSDKGEWSFKDDAAAMTTFRTGSNYNYDKIMYHVTSLRFFVFKVKAEKDAHIALFEHYHTDDVYEFVIGMSGNTYTAIRNKKLGAPIKYRKTENILSGTEFRQFWVMWAGDRLSIGKGHLPGADELVGWDSDKRVSVQYLSFSTYGGVAGEWEHIPQTLNTLMVRSARDFEPTTTFYSFAEGQEAFTFSVRACEQAQIRLLPKIGEDPNYELIIGASGNTATKFYKEGVMVHEEVHMDALDCSDYRAFWVSWADGFFDVAVGSQFGTRILEWYDTNPLPVHTLTMKTGMGHGGDWRIPRVAAPLIRYDAYAMRSYDGFWITVAGTNSYNMRVKAKSNANILLTQVPGISSLISYEIVIGDGEGTSAKTKIKMLKDGKETVLATESTPLVLDDVVFKWFWVSWGHYDESTKGKIKFGSNAVPGAFELIQAEMSETIDINGLALGSSNDKNITWELLMDTGNSYLLRTDGMSFDQSTWLTPKTNVFYVDVVACRDARIALLTDKNDKDNGYEILFGGFDNTASALFHGVMGQELVMAPGRGLLGCTDLKRFWIKWEETSLQIGEGMTDSEPFIDYQTRQSSIIPINMIGFASDAVSNAEWKIPQDQESSILMSTDFNGTYGQHWLTLVGKNRIVFRVKACHSVKIILAAIPGNSIRFATEIVIGKNGKSEIRDGKDGTIKDSANTPDVLDCDQYRSFWLHWLRNGVYVGEGPVVWKDLFLEYKNEDLHDILGMGIATGPPKDNDDKPDRAQWQVFGFDGNTIVAYTPPRLTYDAIDLIPEDGDHFHVTFRVRACADANIMIGPETTMETDYYEVVIGTNSNTEWAIKRGGFIKKLELIPNALSADQSRPFWIYWHKGNLTAGYGELGQFHVISFQDPDPVRMYGMAFTTRDLCDGQWDIDQRVGEKVYIKTPGDHIYDKIHLAVLDTYSIVFGIRASRSAHIALSAVPSVTTTMTYEIGIQANFGRTTYIRKGVKGRENLVEKATKDLLNRTEYRTFWLSWSDKRIKLGKGDTIDKDFIIYTDRIEDLPDFAGVAFCTAEDISGAFEFEFKDRSRSATTTTSTTSTTKRPSTSSRPPSTSTTRRTNPPGTTPTSPTSTTTEEDATNNGGGGMDGGAVTGIVFGVIIGVVLLLIIALLVALRYKPDAVPVKFSSAVPTSIQRRVRRDTETAPVHFTNPVFGDEYGSKDTTGSAINFGALAAQPLNSFEAGSTES